MFRNILIILILLIIFPAVNLLGQYPQHFNYSDENGMPNNEVYSILQDKKGFIWFGSDAGLYKFDGIRYHHYKSETQKSKSITGLNLSVDGKIYCHNFQSQIFYLENDELIELSHSFSTINSILSDNDRNLWVTHKDGIGVYNEKTESWTNHLVHEPSDESPFINTTRSPTVNSKNEIAFITTDGVGIHADNNLSYNSFNERKDLMTYNFQVEWYNNEPWIFSFTGGDDVYKVVNGKFELALNKNLKNALKNTQITRIKQLSDGYLWICTYNGIIRYNPENDVTEIFYPDIAFSDCMIDREGNYWLTTLQFGMFRIPNLDYTVWNDFKKPKLSNLTTDGKNIYFSTVNSELGILNIENNQLKISPTGHKSDIQTLNYLKEDKKVYYYTYRSLYSWDNLGAKSRYAYSGAVKDIQKFLGTYFISESSGLSITDSLNKEKIRSLSSLWTRETAFDSETVTVWAATDNGLLKIEKDEDWKITNNLFFDEQIISLDFNEIDGLLYILRFDGTIASINRDLKIRDIADISDKVKGYRMRYHNDMLYIATNKGVHILDPKNGRISVMNTYNGLASENISDLLGLNDDLWLATGNGLEKIPLSLNKVNRQAKVYVKNTNFEFNNIVLEKGEPLVLYPETSLYSAGDKYEYAYKLNRNDWVKLPAKIEKIELLNIPKGDFNLLLKTIDHLGRDSENILEFSGTVKGSIWESAWFLISAILLTLFISILTATAIIRNIKKKEQQKNVLLRSQLKAIRAQMNPHFMYNTLNSIQDLILQKDIKNTNYYLSRFSHLMRQILDFSREERILLSEETDMLENYLKLEKLRMGDDFKYNINIDEDIDPERIYLPSLLIQPFVENSLKHGLLHKKGAKILNVDFRKENNTLKISISDNGIGQKRAGEIQERSPLKHKSFASGAVLKRIELLNSQGGFKIKIKTADLRENETDPGTKVDITISPIMKETTAS